MESGVLSETLQKLHAIQAELREEYFSPDTYPWIIGYSGGKDSTLLVQLVFELLIDLAPGDRARPVHLLCNDTLVESPVLMSYIDGQLIRLRGAAEALHLPVIVVKTTPSLEHSFWVNLVGRGYPSPTRTFRWCTDRLKIQPTSNYIKQQVSSAGEVILLLGVRRAESAARSKSMNRHQNVTGTRLNPHDDLAGCKVYRPIMELSTDEVWQLLLQRRPPWGGTHRELVTLYRNAQGGECPLVIDKSQAPSCGTSSSRFGCWTCTVVEKDRSMEAMIDSGFEHLEPLLELRDWLAKIRNERSLRMLERRDGRIVLMGDGETTVAGPFTVETRQLILARLLKIQEEVGMPLIHPDEVTLIKSIWAEDAVLEARRLLKQRPTVPLTE